MNTACTSGQLEFHRFGRFAVVGKIDMDNQFRQWRLVASKSRVADPYSDTLSLRVLWIIGTLVRSSVRFESRNSEEVT